MATNDPASQFVPWPVYLEDKRATNDHLAGIHEEVKGLRGDLTLVLVDRAREDGARREKSTRTLTTSQWVWAVALALISAGIGVVVTHLPL